MQGRKPGTVRIIAGKWRGRRLPVPDIEGLRPSGDRSRETLFNWLQPSLAGARCVDLFAGTGVLGLECVSRGAAEAVLVDKSRKAVAAMRQSVELLGAVQVPVVEAEAISWLGSHPARWVDIALVDPPFGHGTAQLVINQLDLMDVIKPGGMVYLESAGYEILPLAGPGWQNIKEKLVGEVRMQLFRKT